MRKQTVEPVFGQIKEARGYRRCLRRGREQVRAEWLLVGTAHNVLNLAARRAALQTTRRVEAVQPAA